MKLHQFMKHLRIGVLPCDAASKLDEIKTSEGTSLYVCDGYIIKLLSQILKFSYTVLQNGGIGESQSDGNWTGCIGMVQNGKSDIAICSVAVTEERSHVVSFSNPYIYTALTFVTDKPQPLPNSYAIIYAFSWQLWLSLVISFVFMSLIIYKCFGCKQTYTKILTRMFGTLTEQSFDMQSTSSYIRLTIISWVIGAMFITFSYKSVLLALFSFPNFSGIFNMKDLSKAAEDPAFQCFVREGSLVFKLLTQSNEEPISKCIKRTPTVTNLVDSVYNYTYKKASFGGRNYLSKFKRDFFIPDDEFFPVTVALIANKNFCCLELLNDVLLRLSEAGLFQKYQDDIEYLDFISAKSSNDVNYSSNRILKLTDLYGAFVFLILGLLLSTLVLVIEIIFHKFKEN